MKTLQDYIVEHSQFNEGAESKSVTFNFSDLEKGSETLDSFNDKEGCTIDGNKLTVTVTPDNYSKLEGVQDILQQFTNTIRNSSKRTNDEQYAQRTKSFQSKVNELNDILDEFTNPENDENDKNDENDDNDEE